MEIKELSWPDAMRVYGKLKEQVDLLMNSEGGIALDRAKIINAITESVDLCPFLVKQSTGKDDAWLNERSISEVLDIATEAAVLNIGIIVDRIKNAASRLKEAKTGAAAIKTSPPTNSTAI